MNICIGGPWHGSKLLGRSGPRKTFKVKDSNSGIVINYFKKKVMVKGKLHIFWLSQDLNHIETDEIVKKYFDKIISL